MLTITNGPVSFALAAHARKLFYATYTRYSIVQKLSNKQSAKVICRLDWLRTAHSKSKKPYE